MISHLQASAVSSMVGFSIPSPSQGVWWIGPIPLRAYGILMVTAMALALWVTFKRYVARGGVGDVVLDMALWAIPFGIVGGRLYHVATTPYSYFGPDGDPWEIFRVWEGGMAIWGAVGLGAVGAWIGMRRAGQRMGPLADALAPGLLLAQMLGRWGNYFNQELFGGPTTLPWGLEIDAAHLPAGYAEGTLFHPTFLYEGLWNVAMAILLVWLDKKIRFKSGQVFSLYLVMYGIGRFWVEAIRIDEARQFLGLRLNGWTAVAVVLAGIILFFVCGKVGASTQVSPEEVAELKLKAAERKGETPADAVEETESTLEEVPTEPGEPSAKE